VPRGGPAGELALGPASPLRAALHAVPLIPDGAICRRDLRAEINNQRGLTRPTDVLGICLEDLPVRMGASRSQTLLLSWSWTRSSTWSAAGSPGGPCRPTSRRTRPSTPCSASPPRCARRSPRSPWCEPTPGTQAGSSATRARSGTWPWHRQAPRPGQGLRPAPPPLGRGTLLRLADQIPPPTQFTDAL
jgi:hypothetical protein